MVVNGKMIYLIVRDKQMYFLLMMSESDKPGFVSINLIVVINLENLLPNFSSDLPKKICRNSK